MADVPDITTFEVVVPPHLPAVYNLARWLTRSDADADDVGQEAYLRAFRYFGGFHGGDARAWLLTIVRNSCYTKSSPVCPSRGTPRIRHDVEGSPR